VFRSLPVRGSLLHWGWSVSLADAGERSPTIRGAAAMLQVSDWLEKLGLSEYAQRLLKTELISQSYLSLPIRTWRGLATFSGTDAKWCVQSESLGAPSPPPTP
jgi:hypothetical protein